MKHGDKAKAKSAKAKASGEKSSRKAGEKSGRKTVEKGGRKAGVKAAEKGGPKAAEKGGPKAAEKSSAKAAEKSSKAVQSSKLPKESSPKGEKGRGSVKAAAGNSKSAPHVLPDAVSGFTNPVVAAAFKRAVKKYPNAFRKLTD